MKYRSTLFDEARNKIGSAVASKNRNGNYFRNLVIPSNPRTPRQTAVRALFTNLSSAWRGLSEAQRMGWTSLAAQVTLRDALGNSYKPTGQQLYVGNNTNLTNAGLAVIDDAPAVPDAVPDVELSGVIASVEASTPFTHTLSLYMGGGTTGQIVLISATAQYSAGRSYVGRSQYRILEPLPLPATVPTSILSPYENLFGSLVVGSKLSVSIVGITVHGFASIPSRVDTLVTTA